ncbi:MAG: ATP-dependent DNA ligase [Bdellovibrionota bacterium]
MKKLSELFRHLDEVTATNERKSLLANYFSSIPSEDLGWSVYVLSDKRVEAGITSRKLRELFLEKSDLQPWLFEESYHHVGDTAETVTLLVPAPGTVEPPLELYKFITEQVLPLKKKTPTEISDFFWSKWNTWDRSSIFLLNKIVTGALRIGVSFKTIVNVLADLYSLPESHVYAKLSGNWAPDINLKDFLHQMDSETLDFFPFCLAAPLEVPLEDLGEIKDWQIEWKYDGIRAQIKKTGPEVVIWTRGEEIVSEQFPELIRKFETYPSNFVLDGEIVVYKDGVLPFNQLQKRLGRKKISSQILSEFPTEFLAYDALTLGEGDLRQRPLRERRILLEKFCSDSGTLISNELFPADWKAVEDLRKVSRENIAEGLMIKNKNSTYREGRHRNFWFKYKVDPLTIDAVLVYAQSGSGRRSNLFTDYTFAVKKGEEYVTFAKAYSGLDDIEIEELDRWIRRHTEEKFGPVRSVKLEQVFEIGFEGIMESQRHKSGFAVRFPRILRWRKDKLVKDIDTVDNLAGLLKSYELS